jgi:putative transposase
MPRQARRALGDGIFHVTARGNAGMTIYTDEHDYRTFLALLKDVAESHAWTLFAYCLMPNHYHLVVRTKGADLSTGMSALNGTWGRRFNKRHKRYGHLFQGRYGSRLIDIDRRTDVRDYVMDNPVRAGLVADANDWPWSARLISD